MNTMEGNPVFRSLKNLYLYFFTWVLVSLIYFVLLLFSLNIDLKIAVVDSIVFNFFLAGLGLAFWYPSKYISFEGKTYKIVFNHLSGALISTAVWLVGGYLFITEIIGLNGNYLPFFGSSLAWRFLIGILFYVVIISFYYLINYYSNVQNRIVKESQLKNLVTQAELKTLKFQINPHFIFNSLNSMSALTDIDPAKAKLMIIKLAEFLRYTLAHNESQKNKLREELKNMRLYLEIEKIRFEDKFEFCEQVDNECLDVEVPNMILQPLIENAIKHAVYETLDKIVITLNGKVENNYLKLSLMNDFEEDSGKHKGTGIGLTNIKNRLKLIYGMDNLVEIKKESDLFTVLLYIPIEQTISQI